MQLQEPILFIDQQRCERNLKRMAENARRAGVGMRPHFKTHQSRAVGAWYRSEGIDCITVSSLAMAEYFADDGWQDILIAFPPNPMALQRYQALAERIRLAVVADHPETIQALESGVRAPLDWYLDVDAGYGRTGVPIGHISVMEALLEAARSASQLQFRGFYCHAGDTYHYNDPQRRLEVQARALADLQALKQHFAADSPQVLMGDTPGCSLAEQFPGVDEITAGNFIFYDLFQSSIGSCSEDDIAVAMACPVVGHYPERGEVVIHGGSVHFSKDAVEINGRRVFGKLARRTDNGWQPMAQPVYLGSVSQEHGILQMPPELLSQIRTGDVVYILPVHSCLTADAMGAYRDLAGQKLDHLRSGK